jgi:hypothetical protein
VRIAIVTESFLPSLNGVTTSVCHVLEQLRAGGHEAVVIAPDPGPPSHAGFPVHRVASVPVRSFRVGLPTAEVVAVLHAFGPDVVRGVTGRTAPGSTGLLFDPEVPGDLLRQVAQLTDGPTAPEHRARMGEAGRAAVRDRSRPALVEELLVHYTAAAAQRTARRTAWAVRICSHPPHPRRAPILCVTTMWMIRTEPSVCWHTTRPPSPVSHERDAQCPKLPARCTAAVKACGRGSPTASAVC